MKRPASIAEDQDARLGLVACPLCGGNVGDRVVPPPKQADRHLSGMRALYGRAKVSVWRVCGECGFVHQNPRPSTSSLNQLYEEGRYHESSIPALYLEEQGARYMQFAEWYYGPKVEYAISQLHQNARIVFDIGSGYGGVLRLFADRGFTTYGAEPDQSLCDYSRDYLGIAGVQRALVQPGFQLPQQVDAVFSNHTLEHVADLDGLMKALRKLVKPGATVFTCVPTYFANRSSLSLAWMNSAHYSLFTHASLSQLYSRYGFEVEAFSYRGWKRSIDEIWHLARFTGAPADAARFYEDPDQVLRYLSTVNPRRSRMGWPVFHNYDKRLNMLLAARKGVRVARRAPTALPREALQYVRRVRRRR